MNLKRPGGRERNGLDRCRSQIPCLFCKILYPRYRCGSPTVSGSKYGHYNLEGRNPTQKSDPSDLGILTHLFSQPGVNGTPEACRNKAGF